MSAFRLARAATGDLVEIVEYLIENAGAQKAFEVEDDLFSKFELLCQYPGLGHHRLDLAPLSVLFFASEPYMIIYRRYELPIEIVGVIHASRNLKRMLRKRLS